MIYFAHHGLINLVHQLISEGLAAGPLQMVNVMSKFTRIVVTFATIANL